MAATVAEVAEEEEAEVEEMVAVGEFLPRCEFPLLIMIPSQHYSISHVSIFDLDLRYCKR